jgi:HYR domain.
MGTAWDAVATDNDEIESITYQLSGVTTGTGTTLNNVVFNLGVTTVTWTAKDLSGNKSICVFKVDVRDKENPIIDNCIDNQRVNTITGTKVYTHKGTSWDITATDNDRVIHLSYELSGATTGGGLSLDGVSFNMGVTTVKWIAVDVAENISTCIFTVTVSDKEVPVIANCVSNQSVNTITG